MKVLFAISNEEISESIVKRYQTEYKQIISSKNVYYFNAILKEIQKDKTYDRIVISEDLEAFTHSQYDQIDKFIFDKLDSISDEASDGRGTDIPIILICTDRRSKGEQILVKLFGIGVYNALIGTDRSVEEVCKLLNRPRTKKEAKDYYKIDSEEVNYAPENEDDVSEVEIQNILAHYKRLGKNESQYVESFDNIAAQYNDRQLRVISKVLPLNVRAVLEEKSPKYQKVMSFSNTISEDLRDQSKHKDGPTSTLLQPKVRKDVMSKPVVIPSAVNMNDVKKLAKTKKEVNLKKPVINKKVHEYQKPAQPSQPITSFKAQKQEKVEVTVQNPTMTAQPQQVQQPMSAQPQPITQPTMSTQPQPVMQEEQPQQETIQNQTNPFSTQPKQVDSQVDNTVETKKEEPTNPFTTQQTKTESVVGTMTAQPEAVESQQINKETEQKEEVLPGVENKNEQPVQTNPFGTSQEQPVQTNPFGTSQEQPAQTNPFGTSQEQPAQTNPFGTSQEQPAQTNPFETKQEQPAQTNPFGTSQEQPAQTNPFGTKQEQPAQTNPFETKQEQPAQTNPFETKQEQADQVENNDTQVQQTQVEEQPKKRGRGRPRKYPLPDPNQPPTPPRKRGRPRKNPVVEENSIQTVQPIEQKMPVVQPETEKSIVANEEKTQPVQTNPFATSQEQPAQTNPFETSQEQPSQTNPFETSQEQPAQTNPFETSQEQPAQTNPFGTSQEQPAQTNPFETSQEQPAQTNPFATSQEQSAQTNPFATSQEQSAQTNPFETSQEPTPGTLPGFESTQQESTPGTLPGFESTQQESTPGTLPGFESTQQESTPGTLPGFESTQQEQPAQTNPFETSQEPTSGTLPGFENTQQQSTPGTLPGFESTQQEQPAQTNPFETNQEQPVQTNPFETSQESTNLFANQTPNPEINNTTENNFDQSFDMQNNYGGYSDMESRKKRRSEYVNTIDLSSLLTPDKKVIACLGTSKNGTSFIINNLAELTSSMGINTAILDTTSNRNAYYIYTKNEEGLREIALNSFDSLINKQPEGIKVNKNLTVFTSLPDDEDKVEMVDEILETLIKNYSLVLIDTDFTTPIGYFKQIQELYLVQSLDILTIQPLTAFLRKLKSKNALEENKIRIILNKAVKVKGIQEKTIIGGMAFYTDPAMSYMTELFDRNTVKYITIPFEDETYVRYLENIINCEITLKGYSKVFMQSLKELANIVYPLTGNGQSTYRPPQLYGNESVANTTLDQMRRNNY